MSFLNLKSDDGQTNEGFFVQNFLSVSSAVKLTGYNGQYLRRLLRTGKLSGVRVGQIWLILFDSLKDYINLQSRERDRRCGARKIPHG